MSDVQCMLQSELNLEEAQTEDNLKLFQPENRRFRDAIGVTGQSENSGQFSNVSQFNFGQRKFEVGMWLDIKDTITQRKIGVAYHAQISQGIFAFSLLLQ